MDRSGTALFLELGTRDFFISVDGCGHRKQRALGGAKNEHGYLRPSNAPLTPAAADMPGSSNGQAPDAPATDNVETSGSSAIERFMRDASAFVERLQALAVAVKELAAQAKAGWCMLPPGRPQAEPCMAALGVGS
jgi:hypothetical protein